VLAEGAVAFHRRNCSPFRSGLRQLSGEPTSRAVGLLPDTDHQGLDGLKAKMTGDKAESLGTSIHDLKPDVDAKAEEAKAKKQAKADMAESNS
jgi:hypothetical protein